MSEAAERRIGLELNAGSFFTRAVRGKWVFWIFPLHPTMENLMISYPVSWTPVSVVNDTILFVVCRKMFRKAAHPIHYPGFGQLAPR